MQKDTARRIDTYVKKEGGTGPREAGDYASSYGARKRPWLASATNSCRAMQRFDPPYERNPHTSATCATAPSVGLDFIWWLGARPRPSPGAVGVHGLAGLGHTGRSQVLLGLLPHPAPLLSYPWPQQLKRERAPGYCDWVVRTNIYTIRRYTLSLPVSGMGLATGSEWWAIV